MFPPVYFNIACAIFRSGARDESANHFPESDHAHGLAVGVDHKEAVEVVVVASCDALAERRVGTARHVARRCFG